MVFVYIVRCNFTAPEKEQAWNAWYSGPKIVQMLTKPYFRSCQRFQRISGTGRSYLALWTVSKPEALRTPEYLAQWGFDEWAPHITDWSRDLFDGGKAAETDFTVARNGALRVVAFDGLGADDAEAARSAIAASNPAMRWLPIAGLDRHTPWIGLERLDDGAPAPDRDAATRAQQAIYRPISEFHVAGTGRDQRARASRDLPPRRRA